MVGHLFSKRGTTDHQLEDALELTTFVRHKSYSIFYLFPYYVGQNSECKEQQTKIRIGMSPSNNRIKSRAHNLIFIQLALIYNLIQIRQYIRIHNPSCFIQPNKFINNCQETLIKFEFNKSKQLNLVQM